jgi:hypothetical protein
VFNGIDLCFSALIYSASLTLGLLPSRVSVHANRAVSSCVAADFPSLLWWGFQTVKSCLLRISRPAVVALTATTSSSVSVGWGYMIVADEITGLEYSAGPVWQQGSVTLRRGASALRRPWKTGVR